MMQPMTLNRITILWIAFAVWNAAVFVLYGADKKKAARGEWRISERTLLLAAFFFGGAGAFLGMLAFRHKTKHTACTVLVPLFAVLGFAATVYITAQTGDLGR